MKSQRLNNYLFGIKTSSIETIQVVTPLKQNIQAIQQDSGIVNLHEHSTDQKSHDPEVQVQQDERQYCKQCKYNLNEQSQLWRMPFQMLPFSEEQSAGNQQANQQIFIKKGHPKKRLESTLSDNQSIIMKNGELLSEIKKQSKNLELKHKQKTIIKKKSFQNQKIHTCKCKKTHCLKSYCQCFLNNVGCSQKCQCINCGNQMEPIKPTKKTKIIKKQQKIQQIQKISNVDIKINSCHCKKTNCLKNYCQCFHSGQECGQHCNCKQCKNMGSMS